MSAAARLRRRDECAEIIVLERSKYVSFANCGLPYYVGGEIEDPAKLILHTPQSTPERTSSRSPTRRRARPTRFPTTT